METRTDKCPNCDADNPENFKFCGTCGASLTAKCSKCGGENPLIYRYCGTCGIPLWSPKQLTNPKELVAPPSGISPIPNKRTGGCGCQVGGCVLVAVLMAFLISVSWFLIQPGVFTIQPIGALPEGVTFIYHSRSPDMPLFSSPDGLCLKIQRSVTLLCRAAAISATSKLTDRMMIKLPYIKWAYLQSTGGLEFDR